MKTVASFREPYQAHLAKGRLEAEGIPAFVSDEYVVQMDWTHSEAVGGVKVKVLDECLGQAREILAADYGEDLLAIEGARFNPEFGEICPRCGSSSISAVRHSFWSFIPSLLFLVPFFFRRKKWVCKSCGSSWYKAFSRPYLDDAR